MKKLRLVISIATLALSACGLRAAELYWDPTGSAGVTPGGMGNWDQTDAFWFNGTGDVAWMNANGDDANFTGTAGTVTLTENIVAGNLFFTNVTGNYYITNATGAESLTIGGTIDTGGGEHTIAVPVSASTLNKNGDGRLHLSVANPLSGALVNQGELSIENNGAVGGSGSSASSVTVADGAALEFNGGSGSVLTAVYVSPTINGSGITNSGSLRNKSGTTTLYGQITLGENNSVIFADSGSSLVCDAEFGPLTDNGNNYNLIIDGSGTGNVHVPAMQIGGSLIVNGPASCYTYLNGMQAQWTNTYVGPGASFWMENSNGVGSPVPPNITMETTNLILDGASLNTGGTYTMYTNAGITVTASGATFTNASGTCTTGSIYSPSNGSVAFTANGTSTFAIATAAASSVLNIGSGTLVLNGNGSSSLKLQSAVPDVFSNLVQNGGLFTFNYDLTSGQPCNLGTLPNAFSVSNIFLNGGQFHIGHSTTIQANRGIYVTSAGTTIQEVTSSGTATFNCPISGLGNVVFAGATYALTASNSYANTTINSSTFVSISGSGTLGRGPTADNGTLVINRSGGTYAYGGIISGTGSFTKSGTIAVTLSGINTYSGLTTNTAGVLLINGTNSGAGTVYNLSGATLGGTGVIKGVLTNNAGGTINVGIGTLSVSNNVSNAGNVAVVLNKSLTQSNGMLVASGLIINTNTDTLLVTNVGPALVAGDTFQVFNKSLTGSGTMAISGPANVTWVNNLAVDGTISVTTAPTPVLSKVQLIGSNFIFSGTNGPGQGKYYVLSTTNLTTPLSQWTDVSTNSFLNNGQFFITNPMSLGTSQLFYTLQVP